MKLFAHGLEVEPGYDSEDGDYNVVTIHYAEWWHDLKAAAAKWWVKHFARITQEQLYKPNPLWNALQHEDDEHLEYDPDGRRDDRFEEWHDHGGEG